MADAQRSKSNPAVEPVLLALGHAVWQLQLLEDTLASHLVLVHDLQPGCGRERLAQALTHRRKLTFGQLFTVLAVAETETPTLSPQTSTRLATLKIERNWLVHRSRREEHVKINTGEDAERVIARIKQLFDDTTIAMTEVHADTERVLESRGVDMAQVAKQASAVMRSWGCGVRHPDEVGET